MTEDKIIDPVTLQLYWNMGYEEDINKYVQYYWISVLKMVQNVGKSTAVGKLAELMILMCTGKSEIIPVFLNSMIITSYSWT